MGKASKSVKAPAKARATYTKSSSGQVSGAQKILDFVLFFETTGGNPQAPRKKVASMSGLRANTFPVTISGLKKKGLITYDKDTICLTEQGREMAQPMTDSSFCMDNGKAQEEIKQKFKIGGKAALLFDKLKDGRVHDRHELINEIGFGSKGSAAVMLCNLKKNGIIEYDKTTIKMSDMCFPCGRAEEE